MCSSDLDKGLSRTAGDLEIAAETVLGLGVGVEGGDVVMSSDNGLGDWTAVDCVEKDECLLSAKMEPGDDMELSGESNEEC